jgi:hypothetical protein
VCGYALLPCLQGRISRQVSYEGHSAVVETMELCEWTEDCPLGPGRVGTPRVSDWLHGPYRLLRGPYCPRHQLVFLPCSLLGLSLPGGVRLVTWTVLADINRCFDCKITRGAKYQP